MTLKRIGVLFSRHSAAARRTAPTTRLPPMVRMTDLSRTNRRPNEAIVSRASFARFTKSRPLDRRWLRMLLKSPPCAPGTAFGL